MRQVNAEDPHQAVAMLLGHLAEGVEEAPHGFILLGRLVAEEALGERAAEDGHDLDVRLVERVL